MTGFVEIADRVHVLRYPVLDVNITLVVGEGRALIVDTLSTASQARELAAEARRVTAAPWHLVNTHHHFDHCLGNATLACPDTEIWAHTAAADLLRHHGRALLRQWYTEWAPTQPELAEGIAAANIRVPEHTVAGEAELDIGGRRVVLRHTGRGHTAGDLAVVVPDAGVLVPGDLLEESGPPQFDDGYPIAWPDTVAGLLGQLPSHTRIVPGHGAVVDVAFAHAQHAELAALAWLIRDGHADGAPAHSVAMAVTARTRFPAPTAEVAVRRGYAELDGA